MKRWQDRGEVLDSDDEESDLEGETESHVSNRTQIEAHDERNAENGAVGQDGWSARCGVEFTDQDDEWLHPKVANTYGKKSKASTTTVRSSLAPEYGQHNIVARASTAQSQAESPNRGNTITGLGSTGSQYPPAGARPCVVEFALDKASARQTPATFQFLPSLQTTGARKGDQAVLETKDSDSESLPDLRHLLARKPNDDERGRQDGVDAASACSSPLSERSVSPPAPDNWLRAPQHEYAAPMVESLDDGHMGADVSTDHVEALATAQTARRTFRTRKAQQLHPYEYEKIQYHKQLKERGVRPVRVLEAGKEAAKTQNAAYSDDEQHSWQISQQASSSPVRASSEIGGGMSIFSKSDSDNELPALIPPGRRVEAVVIQRGPKRQKLLHYRTRSLGTSTRKTHLVDEFTIPHSPPPTSSESNDAGIADLKPAIFRFPRGMTPARQIQQPTPNVSSEVRPAQANSDDEVPQRSRLSTASKPRRAPNSIHSCTESSAADSERDEGDADVHRLLKERKRIRGVLPASWLKIDFKAQQRWKSRSPSRRHDRMTESPEKAMPQRGVAHRIVSRPLGIATQNAPIPISDSESDDERSSNPLRPEKQQARLQFDRRLSSQAQAGFVEDDRMEVDHVDAMLSGTSSSKPRKESSKKRQPRVTDAFSNARDERSDFAEERRAARRAGGSFTRHSKHSESHTKRRAALKSLAPRLSILDAPLQATASPEPPPQFVRLALRRARGQQDQGRHSPTRKHIRLATERDTEDATSVLRAWREGTVAPRHLSTQRQDRAGDLGEAGRRYFRKEAMEKDRVPLSAISGNQQSRLPDPLRATVVERSKGAKQIRLAKSTMRQSRLKPVSLETDEQAERTEQDITNRPVDPSPREDQHRWRSRPRVAQARYRAAQLEALESDYDRGHRAAAFERRMRTLTENVVSRSQHIPAALVQLNRFLHDPDIFHAESTSHHVRQPQMQRNVESQNKSAGQTERLVPRPRKRRPRRIDAEAKQYRQPSEPLPDVIDLSTEQVDLQPPDLDMPGLQGLRPFGSRYPVDFDSLPLPLGTYFHQSSFIGSGDFAASLNFGGRSLDVAIGRIRIHVDEQVLDLGTWNEEVAVGLATIPGAVADALQSLRPDAGSQNGQDPPDIILANVDYLLRSAVRYFTRCLAFSDPVDRRVCARSLQRFVEDTLEIAEEPRLAQSTHKDISTRCVLYAAVLSRQALGLCNHPTVPHDLIVVSEKLFRRATGRLASQFVHAHLDDLRSFNEDLRHAAKRDAGIRDTDAAICAVTVLHHLLQDATYAASFWSIIYQAMSIDVAFLKAVSGFDKVWCNLFAVLPALELDSRGMLQLGSRLTDAKEDWSLPKALLERLFQLYPATSTVSGSTVNEYVRVTLIRCSRLLSRWGWYRCEPMLYSVSDFFARRGLAQLHREENRGSPSFLDDLDKPPSLDVHGDDRSFHIFLKMLASGTQNMRDHQIYPDRKIGGFAWRFIPNHGRTHRKDNDVRQGDLDALRNHHDLLCTIYYASPPNNRIRVDLIRNLVDHSASHREACRLNTRAWRTLAAFQASTFEAIAHLEPFNSWMQELLTANIMQFRLARTEVEQDVASALASGEPAVSQDIIESTIAANQRQIAATITDALAAIKHTLRSACSATAASSITKGTTFWQAFELFDPTFRRIFGMFDEGLEVIKAVLDARQRFLSDGFSQQGSDDSQDYGDSNALQELASTQLSAQPKGTDFLEVVHAPLADFVSNVFGADSVSDDALLTKVVDIWVQLADQVVRRGEKSWISYISAYSSEAWCQLRDTEQRRKYTPYLLARIVESSDVDVHRTGILQFWLKSLVEREATLKFQHRLTGALLSRQLDEPLLANLPFLKPRGGHYAISLQELRQSRLGLISSVLSNMHQHFDSTMLHRPRGLPELRRTYGDMLRQMMQTMRLSYQEVQPSGDGEVADAGAQGEYVGFVHQVVSFLLQYTTDICPVDRFFTDSSTFPLPAGDPDYLVGKLKAYVPKLAESRKRKGLAVFLQTVIERAATDGQQVYLVDQLVAAMIGVLERGSARAPSLRHVLMTAIFPAYIENALSTACSWILAMPVLQACARTMEDLLYCVNLEDADSLQAALDTLELPLRSMLRPLETTLVYPGHLMFAHVLAILTTMFDSARQGLAAMQHIARLGRDSSIVRIAEQFGQFASAIGSLLRTDEDPPFPDALHVEEELHSPWIDTHDFARKQCQDKKDDWQARDGQYFIRRATGPVEVVIHLQEVEDEKERLLSALQHYQESYKAIFGRREAERQPLGFESLVV